MHLWGVVVSKLIPCLSNIRAIHTLSPSNFIPTEYNILLMQSLPDQVPSNWWNVCILFLQSASIEIARTILTLPENHNNLSLDLPTPLQRIIILPLPQRATVYVCGEEAYGSSYTWIKSTSKRQMTTKTHARSPYATITLLQR